MSESLLFQASDGSGSTNVTSLTIPITSNPAGAGNKKIIVFASLIRLGSTVPRTFTLVDAFGGALTLFSDDQQTNTANPGTRCGIFSANLSGTGTGNLVITASGLCRIFATVWIVDSLDQSAAPVTAKSTNLSALSVTVTGAVFGGVANSGNNYAITNTGAQTTATGTPIAASSLSANETNFAAGSLVGGSGSQTFTWSAPNTNATQVIAGYARVSGASPIAGSLSKTLGAVTTSTAGNLRLAGAVSATVGPVALATTGKLRLSGSTGVLLGAVTATAVGSLGIQGSVSASLGAVTVASVGALSLRGALNTSIGGITAVISGGAPSDTDLTATPDRTFVSAGRARTYSGTGARRIFVLDTRRRTF